MTIYGQTEDIIVRKLTEEDAEKYLELMAECGTAVDYTVDEIKLVLRRRERNGNIQAVITSADGNTIYGFCGILHTPIQAPQIRISFFKKYSNEEYNRQVKTIMESLK